MSPTRRARAVRVTATVLASVAAAAVITGTTITIRDVHEDRAAAVAERADATTTRDEQADDLRILTTFEVALTVKADQLAAQIASTDGFLK